MDEKNDKKRLLNIGYGIEIMNGRLSGSSADVERGGNAKNITFVKKINGKGMIGTCCAKWNMQRFAEEVDGMEISRKVMEQKKDGKKSRIIVDPNPEKYFNDDVFGFMQAIKAETLEEKVYENLDEENKKLYRKKGNSKKYEKIGSGTMKRKSRVQMSPIISVSNKITTEWCVSKDEDGKTLPLNIETYAGVSYGIANININEVGKFCISDDEEFRDYSVAMGEEAKIKNLNNEEKLKRLKTVLRSIEYLSIAGNQSNYLTDTKPKFIILGEYSWGNNIFQGIMKEDGIDIDMLEEAMERNEEFRESEIWIGIDKFNTTEFDNAIENIKKAFKGYKYVNVDNVHKTFESYIKYLEKTLLEK